MLFRDGEVNTKIDWQKELNVATSGKAQMRRTGGGQPHTTE